MPARGDYFEALVQHAADAIVLLSPDGLVLFASEAYNAVGGVPAQQLIGQDAFSLVHPDDVPRMRAEFSRCLSAPGMRVQAEYRAHHPVDTWRDREVTLINRLDHPALQAVVANIRDITAQKAAERERQLLEEQFRQAQKMEAVGRLAGGVAHDFNNLLTAIIGYSELALDEPTLSAGIRRDLEEIHKAAQSAAGLTRQLLAFSRRQMLQPQTLDVNDVIRRMESLLRRLIGEDVELVTRLSSPLDVIHADPTQIEQIILNLAVNARDAMPHGGRLFIETTTVNVDEDYVAQHRGASLGPHISLVVTDTGTGMDEETRNRLFEPFFTTKERGRGTGLGLATVYGIVKQSGGSIWVYSEPGHGATFKVLLPVAAGAVREREDTAAPVGSLRGTETILVVDDQAEVRAIAREALARQGYVVIEAGSPRDAIALMETEARTVDLLFTDVVMPQMSGRDLAMQLTARWPRLRVVYTSGYSDAAIVQDRIIAPNLAFVPKPFTARALATKIREVLDTPQMPEL